MRRCYPAVSNILPALVGLLALPASAGPLDTAGLARCAAVAVSNERLACYDAFAVSALRADSAVTPGATAGPAAPTAAVASAPNPGAIPSANLDDPANFGLNRQQLKSIPSGPDSVKSVVSQMTQDRLNNVSIVLDNGQTWTFVEQDPRLRPGDTITIKRAALGSFLMTTPSRRSYRVQRSK